MIVRCASRPLEKSHWERNRDKRGCEESGMRGSPDRQAVVYHHTFDVADLLEANHPLRRISRVVDRALTNMSSTFKAAYSEVQRPGVPLDMLRNALLLQCLNTTRSERGIAAGNVGFNHRLAHRLEPDRSNRRDCP